MVKSLKCHFHALGFTLAELLITLAVLGVIAAFSIPKIIVAQQNQQNNAKAKEFAGTIAAAYRKLQLEGTVDNNTGPYNLIPYMNYAAYEFPSGVIDSTQNAGTQPCDPCIAMHNGSRAAFGNGFSFSFGGNNANNAIFFIYDPDGQVTDGTTNGPGKSVMFLLFRSGLVTSAGKYAGTYCMASGCTTTSSTDDPPWLSW